MSETPLCECGHEAKAHYLDLTAGEPPLPMCDGSFFCQCERYRPIPSRCYALDCTDAVAGVFFGHNSGRPYEACDAHLRSAETTHRTEREVAS
jgi:hypothetical protein